LGHILEEMDFLAEYCSVVEIDKLMADKVLRRACVKSFEIIGEASRNISDDLKRAHPEIPWREMTGMRNKLVHHGTEKLEGEVLGHCDDRIVPNNFIKIIQFQ